MADAGTVRDEAAEKGEKAQGRGESSDEGQLTTDYESDRPATELSMSGAVADNEGSSPEPKEERRSKKKQPAEEGEDGGVVQEEGGGGGAGQVVQEEGGGGGAGEVVQEEGEGGGGGGVQEEGGGEVVQEEGGGGGGEEVVQEEGGGGGGEEVVQEEGGGGAQEKEASQQKTETGAPEEEEEEREISYDYEQLKSTPEMVNVSERNLLELHHSFGYECQKRSNLVVLARDVVAFAVGNLVQILHLPSLHQSTLRSLGGGGIGAIAVHPSHGYFAVGEKGTQPMIAMYTYPDLKLHRILRGGTEELYSHMDFSPGEGSLLASVGGNPDYMLTVWDWGRENIVLRSKAFSQDIYRVTFSPENPGQLTTSGTGHIRFWKMATTFTGLKLQGQLGKFGRTELTDISAYVELPDGKVLSGTEWGNLLLWDGGFIKVEISKKGKKCCHHGMIEAIYLDEGELISAGADGFVRVWDFETIDNADITEENTVFEMEPLAEIKVGSDVSLKTLARSVDPNTPTLWYAQDAGGAIWKIDIVVSHTRKAPEKLVSYHSGEILGLVCSPITHQAASIAQDGSVRVYDLPSKEVLCHSQFASGGSSLLWAPPTVDPSATTLMAGYQDGVIRVLQLGEGRQHKRQPKHQLTLVHACKPHSKAVTCLAVDSQGKTLASGGKDMTVFFLSIENKYKPLGFLHTPAPVTTLQWSSGKKRASCLLVCCEDGSMLEVGGPEGGQFDTSKTYHLSSLPYSSREFVSIKDRLRREEEEARCAAERERWRRERERERELAKQRKREQMGEGYVSEEEEEEWEEEGGKEGEGEGEEEEEQAEEEERPKGPNPILAAVYSHQDDGQYWVSMGGYDAGYLYCCSMEGAGKEREPYEAPHSLPVPAFSGDDLPLHSLTFSSSGEYLLVGSSDGKVRVHPLATPFSLTSLEAYWALSMHDNHYGAVTHLVASYDDKFVLSGGADGNVFVYQAHLPAPAQRKHPAAQTKVSAVVAEPAKDIEDPSHYSIEDAKQKAEHDRKMKLAEEKKQGVRRQVGSLRKAFRRLQRQTQELPEPLRLSQREFVMDPEMEAQRRQQTKERVTLVKREMAWQSEKHNIALRKLQKRYKEVVECEHVTVWTFSGEQHVSSFRSAAPSKEYRQLIEEVLSSELTQTPWTVAGKRAKRRVAGGEKEREKKEGEEGAEPTQQPVKLSKTEARRLRKEQRKKEWEELCRRKPGEKSEAPGERDSLQHFKENMGDYKLKTSSDYVVPEHQRVSTKRKRKQLLLLRNQIFDHKREYNRKLLALRDQKLKIIEKISELVDRVKELQSQLPSSLHRPVPAVPQPHSDEVPERALEYTRESLLEFKKDHEARMAAEKQAAAGVGEGFGGFGGFGGGDQKKEEEEEGGGRGVEETGMGEMVAEEGEGEEEQESAEGSRPPSTTMLEEEPLTPLQALRKQEQQVRMVYERDCLLEEVEQLQSSFDETLQRLRHEKTHLDVSIVSADLKHITQFEELQLLKEFEKSETTFTLRYRTRKKECQEMETKIEEAQWALADKEKEVGQLQEREKALHLAFTEAIGENNKFKDFLLKVFRKKVKRAKRHGEEKGVGGRGEEEGEGSDEESESDYSSSSEEESESEEGVDDSTCPPGCDSALFQQACALREQRLDLEEVIGEGRRALEQQRRDLESMRKKAKSMEAHVKTALSELQAFQLKKQQRMNELDQVAILRLSQLLYFRSGGEPPTSILPCLVFPASALLGLTQRIGELGKEKQEEKKRYKELRQKHSRLGREKKEMMWKVGELEERAKEIMMLKFGRVVDLDRLEGLSVNRIVEELQGRLRALERKADRKIAALQSELAGARQQLVVVTRENTHRLDRMNELLGSQRQLEERLNARQKTMSMEVGGGEAWQAREEREQLRHLVRLQGREIGALREEIRLLLHKGGHILPPSQPPIAPSPGTLPSLH